MKKYIEFPIYAIYLIPNNDFNEIIYSFYEDNKFIKNDLEYKTKFQPHFIIKAPFYINNQKNEKDLISSFLNLKNEIIIPSELDFNKMQFDVKSNKNFLRLELKKNLEFDFFCNQIVRRYDEFRKVLSPIDYKKDISHFGELTNNQIINYQIWGYPYLFEESTNYLSILNLLDINKNTHELLRTNIKQIFHNFTYLNFSKISLVKQIAENKIFKEISSIKI